MEITGKLISIEETQSGTSARGDWTKHGFVIETNDNFPKKVFISFWNNKFDMSQFPIGEQITVSINVESREFNGRWYTDITAWKIEKAGSSNSVPPPSNNDVPPPPPPAVDDAEPDDLPF